MKTRYYLLVTVPMIMACATLGGCLAEAESPGIDGSSNAGSGIGPQNRPPVISGDPVQAITVDKFYHFTPTASDPDGDPLTFSIDQKPAWATFDSRTGTLSGTPTIESVGVTTGIVISVTDGNLRSALSPFSLEVTQIALGSLSLSWSPPTENTDGTMLTNLAGYKIYYGSASGNYTNVVLIDNPSVTTYLLENLAPDTYYLAATAFNSAGSESGFSGEAVRYVN